VAQSSVCRHDSVGSTPRVVASRGSKVLDACCWDKNATLHNSHLAVMLGYLTHSHAVYLGIPEQNEDGR
jgi:hypothetical protein